MFHDGAFQTDSAILVLISTGFPFKIFKTQHFVSLDERLVVTEADPEHRIVKEINGRPAAEEYARVIGVPPDDLCTIRFASSPVVVVIDGTDYVRSIQKANPDGSLTFFCAIEEGLVFRVARGVDLKHVPYRGSMPGITDLVGGQIAAMATPSAFICWIST